MKTTCCYIILIASAAACSPEGRDSERKSDSAGVEANKDDSSSTKSHSNARFRNVTVRKVAEDRFIIIGQGQIFEANLGWVVEDGHQELKSGYEMTDAGAPSWGNFKFEIEVEKQRPNSTLTLVLYESSAEDGSRLHELPVPLR